MNCNLLPDNKDTNDDTRKIKQRSEEWFSIRKQAKVTGSTLYKAIGLENLSSMRDYFDNVICNLKEAPKNQFTISAMQHGTDNEINAVSTLVGKILPSLFPDMEFYEEGCVKLFDGFMVVSPDGTIGKSPDLKGRIGIEFKCPVRDVHRCIPERCYLQCLATMYAVDAETLLFVSWTENVTTVFERCFAYRTWVSTVYKPVEKWSNNSIPEIVYCGDSNSSDLNMITSIIQKNHVFDEKSRTRVKGKKKEGEIDRDRNAILKGTLGVRWETARRKEGKMLMTKKNGIE